MANAFQQLAQGLKVTPTAPSPTLGSTTGTTAPPTAPTSTAYRSVYNPATAYNGTSSITPPSTPAPVVDTTKPIVASSLKSTTKTYPPTVTTTSAQNGLSAAVMGAQEQADTNIKEQQKQSDAAATAAAAPPPAPEKGGLKDTLASILGLNEKLSTKSSEQDKIYSQEGVDTKKELVTKLTNDIASKGRAYDKQIDKIRKENPQGIGSEVADAKIAELTRQKNSELADLAIQQQAASGNYNDALDIAKRKVDAEFEPIQSEIDNLKSYYQLAANDMTESEKVQAQAVIQEKQQQANFERDKKLAEYKQTIDEASPLYQAQVAASRASTANAYSQISARNNATNENGTLNGKPQTAAQSLVGGFAERMNQANAVLTNQGSKFTGKTAIGGSLPNIFQSGDRQQYEQAKQNFVNAVLRRESGAAISPSEFNNAAKQYFPVAGDKPETVAQKAANRQLIINSFYKQANVAQPILPGAVIESDGKKYKVGDDGESLTEV